jgi:hypothetical protein
MSVLSSGTEAEDLYYAVPTPKLSTGGLVASGRVRLGILVSSSAMIDACLIDRGMVWAGVRYRWRHVADPW